jgi:hypothetical protein
MKPSTRTSAAAERVDAMAERLERFVFDMDADDDGSGLWDETGAVPSVGEVLDAVDALERAERAEADADPATGIEYGGLS